MKNNMHGLIAMSALNIAAFSVNSVAAQADPSASSGAPVVQYQSPFKDYRPLGEDKRIPWKKANDDVGKIGGWRVYAREATGNDASGELRPARPIDKPAGSAEATMKMESPAVDKMLKEPVVKPKGEPSSMENKGHAGHGQPK